jgi:preprotein translocase subunit SecE
MAKQEAAAERERARQAPLGGGVDNKRARRKAAAAERGEREPRLKRWARFLREVRQELKKVAWPSRQEVLTYTVVVLVSVTSLTLFVFALDFGFSKLILHFFR